MKPKIHVMLCDDIGERFFGEGPCRLLHRIEETGSLRAAAQAMGLSYSKALRMVKRAEKELGFALTRKTIGGRGGGGSTLTDEARNFMERYEAYRDACVQTSRELYSAFFPGAVREKPPCCVRWCHCFAPGHRKLPQQRTLRTVWKFEKVWAEK